jgi:hypothetical protein
VECVGTLLSLEAVFAEGDGNEGSIRTFWDPECLDLGSDDLHLWLGNHHSRVEKKEQFDKHVTSAIAVDVDESADDIGLDLGRRPATKGDLLHRKVENIRAEEDLTSLVVDDIEGCHVFLPPMIL